MVYVILLLVIVGALVAFVLKKRNAEKQTPAKPIAKKSVTKTDTVEEPIVDQKKTTPLAIDVRQKIEALIEQKNYFAAEAQINQALNRNNKQHELYLLLLEIHIKQKDDFAITQLMSHIQSLELHDILIEAKQKKVAYETESINEKSASIVEDSIHSKENLIKNDHGAQFKPSPSIHEKTIEFDSLVSSNDKTVSDAQSSKDMMTFDFSDAKTATKEQITPTFSSEFDSLTIAKPEDHKQSTHEEKLFSPNTSDIETHSDQNNTNKIEESEKNISVVSKPLEFDIPSFTVSTDSKDQPIETEIQTTVVETPKLDLDFSFKTETANADVLPALVPDTEIKAPSMDFDFSVTDVPAKSFTETPSVSTDEPNLDFNILDGTTEKVEATPFIDTIDENDPLVKSFPQLLDSNEITLNLDLAEQYIQLGAFEAAREILDERQEVYSSEQNERAKQLRNQIA